MKLSKLYSNMSDKFEPILFNEGLNVIVGEIRLEKNKEKDTHNLGKSVLGRLIDFCLLSGVTKKHFLIKNILFKDFIFFIELKLTETSYLTIRRSVKDKTKISFKLHEEKYQDYSDLEDRSWNHSAITFDNAKMLLDGYLNFNSIKPLDFRSAFGYTLRSQSDFLDVFKLTKFRGDDITWKPYLAKVFGFNDELVKNQYLLKKKMEYVGKDKKRLKSELLGLADNYDKLEGLILINNQDINDLQTQLEKFNFYLEDADVNKELVEEFDYQISELNEARYYKSDSLKRVRASLEQHKIIFKPDEAKEIFEESGIYFAGQIKKSFDDLIQFNQEITKERKKFLKEEIIELTSSIKDIETRLNELTKKQSEALKYLKSKDIMHKYKQVSTKLVKIEAKKLNYENLAENYMKYDEVKVKLEYLKIQFEENSLEINKRVNNSNLTYRKIRLEFNRVIKSILNKDGLVSAKPNKAGNLDFNVEIRNSEGNITSEDDGNTYKKLLCMAFDIAINNIYKNEEFPHFIFHDGAFETLDDRKKMLFLKELRDFSENNQYIMTIIDSDFPDLNKDTFTKNEVILTLHDDGNDGRLFKMREW